jgi:hypothetical protein
MGFGNGKFHSLNKGIVIDTFGNPGAGGFQWIQLLRRDNITYTESDESTYSCTASRGFDPEHDPDTGTLQYPSESGPTFLDSPPTLIGSPLVAVNMKFAARAYLMWIPDIPNSIPVPLGSVWWSFIEGSKPDVTAPYGWTTPTAMASPGEFLPGTEYPTWIA